MDRNSSTERAPLTSLSESFERYLQDKGKGRGGDGGNYRRNAARELERFVEWAGIVPDDIDVNALSNLTTLCRACHNWVHQRALPEQVPVTVTDADMTELSPTDIDIVEFLAADGPAGTGAVRDAVTAELSMGAVREHLERLMALDNLVEARDQQLIDRDRETSVWGLPDQIDASARGYVPDDHRTFAQRLEDEQIRRALDVGHDRETVADVFDVSLRSTYHK